jgi:hypothetical protein
MHAWHPNDPIALLVYVHGAISRCMHACLHTRNAILLEYVYYMLVVLFILKKLGDTIELTCHDRPWISWLLGDLFQNGAIYTRTLALLLRGQQLHGHEHLALLLSINGGGRERGGKDEKQDGAMGGRKKIYAKN